MRPGIFNVLKCTKCKTNKSNARDDDRTHSAFHSLAAVEGLSSTELSLLLSTLTATFGRCASENLYLMWSSEIL
jgi:hypothetical protein